MLKPQRAEAGMKPRERGAAISCSKSFAGHRHEVPGVLPDDPPARILRQPCRV